MKSNLTCIGEMIDYIESHLDDKLDLDDLAVKMNYSKYHLHRMFTAIVGMPVHVYIQRRRLTEAAKKLVFSDEEILSIALSSGYETQRSFTKAFRALFRCSPNTFRKHQRYLPFQLRFEINEIDKGSDHMILEIEQRPLDKCLLVGYHHATEKGFRGIGKCWHKLHKTKESIPYRIDPDFLIGVNDYTKYALVEDGSPHFDYYAVSQVSELGPLPKGMTTLELPPSLYVVFRFKGHNEDSMEQISNYIYKEWFPSSTCCLNDKACYDFVKYSEFTDEKGFNTMEYWVPILS